MNKTNKKYNNPLFQELQEVYREFEKYPKTKENYKIKRSLGDKIMEIAKKIHDWIVGSQNNKHN